MEEVKKTEAEISLEFLEEYKKLVKKYHRDFIQQPPQIAIVNFADEPPKNPNRI